MDLPSTPSLVIPDPHIQGLFQKQYMQQQRQRQQQQQLFTFNPNHLSDISASSKQTLQQQDLCKVQAQPQLQLQAQHQQHQSLQEKQFHDKSVGGPGRPGGPALSLDTSGERLQNIKVIQFGNKSYLKLFSPSLVESPVSFLDYKQMTEDKQLWENGPNEAFQKQLDMEKREAFRGKTDGTIPYTTPPPLVRHCQATGLFVSN